MIAIGISVRLLIKRQTFVIALFHKAEIPSFFPTNNVAKFKTKRELTAGLEIQDEYKPSNDFQQEMRFTLCFYHAEKIVA